MTDHGGSATAGSHEVQVVSQVDQHQPDDRAAVDPRIRLRSVPCALCSANAPSGLLSARDNEHDLAGEFHVVECGECGHRYLDPRPTPDSLDALYPADYSVFSATTRPLTGWRWRLAHVRQFGRLPRRGDGRLLEIGCGSGVLLASLTAQGRETLGIEPSATAAAAARAAGMEVLVGTEQLVDTLDPESFAEIYALMVVEHVPDPIATLRRAFRVAAPGAVLTISVPNFGSRGRRRFGRHWFPLQLPRHFHHFDRTTITRALEDAGWRVERVWFQPTTADLFKSVDLMLRGTRLHRLAALLVAAGRILDLLALPVAMPLAQLVGTSRMTIVSRRPD